MNTKKVIKYKTKAVKLFRIVIPSVCWVLLHWQLRHYTSHRWCWSVLLSYFWLKWRVFEHNGDITSLGTIVYDVSVRPGKWLVKDCERDEVCTIFIIAHRPHIFSAMCKKPVWRQRHFPRNKKQKNLDIKSQLYGACELNCMHKVWSSFKFGI